MAVFAALWSSADPAPERELPDRELADQIVALTKVRTRELRLPPEILSLYLHDTWRSRRKINQGWMIWAAAVNAACIVFDPFIAPPELVPYAVAARASVSVALVAAAFAMSFASRPGIEGKLTIAVCVFAYAIAGLSCLTAGPELLERYVIQAIFLGGTAVMASRIAWRDTVALTAVALLMQTIFLALPPASVLSTAEKLQAIVFFDIGLIGLALAKGITEQLHYRVFVLGMSDRLQLRAIAEINGRLHATARTDPLTGVANRRHFEEALEELRRLGGPVGLVMFDIDHFKLLNDALGHRAGDRCLTAVAGLLKSGLREGLDLLARIGGEEFVALLPGVSSAEALQVAERIRAAVEARALPNPGGIDGVVTVSAGVSALDADRLDRLLGRADAALYEAKSAGRNQVRLARSAPGRRAA
ncbi:GGDEF domain-containing protein [Hansschlegelia zhihuaiae]|uniref:diguanylate cyclase n=1 Tax=Hansschlegelia zhihuaiae TaxID=405005 RepID=A0A4Q0MF18_9HYPH|nr:GGDEF domain-containing protein [Hansschlegelia zhihuaiae]RXF72060.1 GGDEF domain-containing protein [Hansschlegelia zhihuaiae]